MSTTQIILAGFGGQGILFAGKLLSYAGMLSGKHVSWLPSYGPEMRGGTANCHVIISDKQIASPIITKPDILIALNGPSLDKFENDVKVGGMIIYDSSLISRNLNRDDVANIACPATQIATDMNASTLANMVSLGKLIANSDLVTKEQLCEAMKKSISSKKQDLLAINIKAIEAGM